jgi:signal recognition particle subunit SRP54
MALLEADVSFKVVKSFMKSVQEKAIGQDVLNGLNPGQMVIKIVSDEMTSLMGSETTELKLKGGNDVTVFMMMGLQGAGKTTTCAKLAAKLKSRGRRPLIAACDVYRPAAIKQLQVSAAKVNVPVFEMGTEVRPPVIAQEAVRYAKENGYNVLLLDTAGRLQIDEAMMEELQEIRRDVEIDQTILVVDAMTGQEAVNVAKTFEEKIGIDGVILTKLDGDTRGGAALSIRAACGKPILFAGMGEKPEDLEQFYPDRMTSRILGMGDVLSLIEKAQESMNEERAREMESRFRKAAFGFDDYLESMAQMKKMGGMSSILKMLPGMGGSQLSALEDQIDESQMQRTEAIILSMTPKERSNPDILNQSRKIRIAKGAGVDISEVNILVKQFDQARKLMKQFGGKMGGKRRGGLRLPFGGGGLF